MSRVLSFLVLTRRLFQRVAAVSIPLLVFFIIYEPVVENRTFRWENGKYGKLISRLGYVNGSFRTDLCYPNYSSYGKRVTFYWLINRCDLGTGKLLLIGYDKRSTDRVLLEANSTIVSHDDHGYSATWRKAANRPEEVAVVCGRRSLIRLASIRP